MRNARGNLIRICWMNFTRLPRGIPVEVSGGIPAVITEVISEEISREIP